MKPLHEADILKSLYIDYAIKKYGQENIVIGNEVMYGTSRKVVDLVILYDNHVCAVEIKSDRDNYSRLDEQINEYRNIFDYIIVVVGEKHQKSIQNRLHNDIGIATIEHNTIKQVRRPILQKSQSKTEILYSIPAQHLLKSSSDIDKQLDSDEIRTYFSKYALTRVRSIFYDYLLTKLKPKYNTFINSRGETTCVDALSCFTPLQIIDSPYLSFHMYRHSN